MQSRLLISVTAVLVTISCAPRAPSADFVILPSSVANDLLYQCSRQGPRTEERGWQPNSLQIAEMEEKLASALTARRREGDPDWSRAPEGWRRQYVGIARSGRRYIYGNYFLRQTGELLDRDSKSLWRERPFVMCDGGVEFFGAEYDVETHHFTRFDYSGSYADVQQTR